MRRLLVGHRALIPILFAAVDLITATPMESKGVCRHARTFTGTGEEFSKKCARSSSRISLQDLEYAVTPAPSPSVVQRATSKSNMDVHEESEEVVDGASTPSVFWRHGLAVVHNFSLPGGSIRLLQDLHANISSVRKQIQQNFYVGLGLQRHAQGMSLGTCILFPLVAFGVFLFVYCLHTAWGAISHEMHRSRRDWQDSIGSRSKRKKQPLQSMTIAQLPSGLHLCPELVVPEHLDCTLFVPEIEISEASPNGIISIDDVNNSAVLLTSYSILPNPPKASYEVPGNGKRLVLRSALEDVVVASCRDAEPDPVAGSPGLTILNRTDEVWGMIRPSGPGSKNSHVVFLGSGQKVLIRKDDQDHRTYATDEDGWMLAFFDEAPKAKRMLRISPQADAGLITLTILGTKLLERLALWHKMLEAEARGCK